MYVLYRVTVIIHDESPGIKIMMLVSVCHVSPWVDPCVTCDEMEY